MELPGPLGIARLRRFEREGYVLLPPGYLGEHLLGHGRRIAALPPERDAATDDLRPPGGAVAELAPDRDLSGLAQQILGAGAELVSARVQVNVARGGSRVGPWHRDAAPGSRPDREPPASLSIALALQVVESPFGEIALVPRSHRCAAPADLVPIDLLTQLAGEHGIVFPRGPAGAILVYDPRIVHSSVPNLSPFPARTLALRYSIEDAPQVSTAADVDCPAA